MIRALLGPRSLAIGALALGLTVFLALPAAAQTGQVKGKVLDAQGQPIEGAAILIEYVGALSRRHETKTNKKGEFVQIGLQSGTYKVTATKEKMAQSFDVRVRIGCARLARALAILGRRGFRTPRWLLATRRLPGAHAGLRPDRQEGCG